jgi:HSP90 family molecular chaperone
LIDQFYVFFFSVFLFADKVVVTSKHNDDKYIKESKENKNFTIRKGKPGDNLIRETKVTLSERRSWIISRREENQ